MFLMNIDLTDDQALTGVSIWLLKIATSVATTPGVWLTAVVMTKRATHDEGTMWWNRGLRRRDHTNQVHKYNFKDLFGDKLDVQIYLQCSSMGCFTRSEALQFYKVFIIGCERALFPSSQLWTTEKIGSGTAGHLCEWRRRKAPTKQAWLSCTHTEKLR